MRLWHWATCRTLHGATCPREPIASNYQTPCAHHKIQETEEKVRLLRLKASFGSPNKWSLFSCHLISSPVSSTFISFLSSTHLLFPSSSTFISFLLMVSPSLLPSFSRLCRPKRNVRFDAARTPSPSDRQVAGRVVDSTETGEAKSAATRLRNASVGRERTTVQRVLELTNEQVGGVKRWCWMILVCGLNMMCCLCFEKLFFFL